MKAFGDWSTVVIASCIEVHRRLGPGLLESAYEECLARELSIRHVPFTRQVMIAIRYKGVEVDAAYRLDFLVDMNLIVEVKAVEALLPVHHAQALTYLRLTGRPAALLVNFNVPVLKDGLRRLSLAP